jgi:hypothetical protein
MPETLSNERAPRVFRDNSGLRARLSGQTLENRSIETELRTAMLERQELERSASPGRRD